MSHKSLIQIPTGGFYCEESVQQAQAQAGCRRSEEAGAGPSPFVVVVHKGRHGADLDGVRVVG